MTARELLTLFARLKNIPEEEIPTVVKNLIAHVTLEPYADRVCGSYSGGNKRKLALAIALVGSPAVLILDEPSSGMDPVSRRHMWNIINRERGERSIVLTTHSMEECEALCTRIGIMTGGRFQCLGSAQHLKARFGRGYTLDLRVDESGRDAVHAAIVAMFPQAMLTEQHASKLKFEIELESVVLADVFEKMEANKDALGIIDYSASQPTLENIFLSIVETKSTKPRVKGSIESGRVFPSIRSLEYRIGPAEAIEGSPLPSVAPPAPAASTAPEHVPPHSMV